MMDPSAGFYCIALACVRTRKKRVFFLALPAVQTGLQLPELSASTPGTTSA